MELLVVNARDIKAVPGRKTDVKDAKWICDLLRHGLLRGSFIPDRSQRELRELVRYRKDLIHERAREVNRIQKVLEGTVEALDGIPGIGRRTAEEVLAEAGDDMNRFPSAAHLASWAGLCPGNNSVRPVPPHCSPTRK